VRSIVQCLAFTLLSGIPVFAAAYQAEPPVTEREVLRVDRYADDAQSGSLRWAIETNNREPGRYRIEIAAIGEAPYVIRPASPLPEIKGPVAIEGIAWKTTGQFIVIDGSAYVKGEGTRACPGAVEGQFGTNVRTTTLPGIVLRDTERVELSGLEVRNFCIGILINRASHVHLHDNRIVANMGGAGVMLTGDDGQGQSTATTTIHNRVERNEFIDNGDGLELTRGAAFNLIADNLFRSTDANPEPSQGIEILWGNDNTVVRNRFENYSDGLQINWGNRNFIAANVFTGNSIGVSLTGEGNIVDGNTITGNGIGVAVRPQPISSSNRISANAIHGNGLDIRRCQAGGACVEGQRRGAIVFGVPGLEHAPFVGSRGIGVDTDPSKRARICTQVTESDCQPIPNHDQAAPRLIAVRKSGKAALEIRGELQSRPHTLYRIEFFANSDAKSAEAEYFIGVLPVATDAQGKASFTYTAQIGAGVVAANVTATATAPDGAVSQVSAPARGVR
jgi:3-dehydroshikimate dehydratase